MVGRYVQSMSMFVGGLVCGCDCLYDKIHTQLQFRIPEGRELACCSFIWTKHASTQMSCPFAVVVNVSSERCIACGISWWSNAICRCDVCFCIQMPFHNPPLFWKEPIGRWTDAPWLWHFVPAFVGRDNVCVFTPSNLVIRRSVSPDTMWRFVSGIHAPVWYSR